MLRTLINVASTLGKIIQTIARRLGIAADSAGKFIPIALTKCVMLLTSHLTGLIEVKCARPPINHLSNFL